MSDGVPGTGASTDRTAATIVEGIALAATILEDRDAAAARSGLSEELARAARERLATLSGPTRGHALRSIVGSLRPVLGGGLELPPRAAAILAPDAPRELGARWLAAAGPPRPGFRAAASLRAQLRHAARDDGDRAAREIAELERAWRA